MCVSCFIPEKNWEGREFFFGGCDVVQGHAEIGYTNVCILIWHVKMPGCDLVTTTTLLLSVKEPLCSATRAVDVNFFF